MEAYRRRSKDYIQLLGTLEATSAEDRLLVQDWGRGVTGRILDAGCGPGQWTGFLASLGLDVEGCDPLPEFVDHARCVHPELSFRRGAVEDLASEPGRYGGILCWYSLIHLPPAQVPEVFRVLHGALAPGGTLLLGFYEGEDQERFDHAVAPAYFRDPEAVSQQLREAGFSLLRTERRRAPGARPHAALVAAR